MKLKHQHDKQEGEAQSWPKILIPEYKPIEIGAQSLQLIQGFLTLAKYLWTNIFNIKVKEESIPHEDSNAAPKIFNIVRNPLFEVVEK